MQTTVQNICYVLQSINSTTSKASLISNTVNNLSEGIHRIKCKYWQDEKKSETCGIKYKYCDC